MKKKSLISKRQVDLRLGGMLLAVLSLAIGGFWFFVFDKQTEAASPASGTINPGDSTITWTGTGTVQGAANGEPSCTHGTQQTPATNCDAFTLTVGGTPAQWVGKKISLKLTMGAGDDYDLVVRKESNSTAAMQGDGVTANTPPLDTVVGTSGAAAGSQEEVILSPTTQGVGIYYVRAIYFTTTPVQYNGSATVQGTSQPPPPSACPLPTFDNYQPPFGYLRRDQAGEPSIGVNWNSNNVMTMHRLQASRTTWDDATSPPNPVENTGHIWFPRPMPLVATGLDPIGFTDSVTGRSLFGELSGNFTNGIISDDDFNTFINQPQQGQGVSSSVDHQTIGGGPPSPTAPIARQPNTSYPHMFYYAAQNIALATVSTSTDGGLSWLGAVPAYNLTQCNGLHGHIKVAPNDGTVYLPNKGCGGKSGFARSTDNGLTWTVHKAPDSTAGNTDPSIGIGSGGRVFFAYAGGDNRPHVAVTDDRGNTWRNDYDLGANLGITAAVFPHAVAGDNDRAAVFFLGTTSTNPGDPVGDDATTAFAGTWYPYMAVTCDGGVSWSVIRADNDPLFPGVSNPVQQGVVCTNGTTCPAGTRNLLDFNEMVVDGRGRITAVYADGCNRLGVNSTGGPHPCLTQPDNHPTLTTKTQNQGEDRMTIIRQRGGFRLFAAFDPGGPAAPPLPPPVSIEEDKRGYSLRWATPDNGGAPLTSYRIYRGNAAGKETFVAEVKARQNSFFDRRSFMNGDTTYYKVSAVNRFGESPRTVKFYTTGGSE